MATQPSGSPQASAVPGAPYRYDTKPPASYINLQPSEAYVLQAAAQVFAGYIAAGKVTPENEAQMIENAVTVGIRLAQRVDARIQSAEELNEK